MKQSVLRAACCGPQAHALPIPVGIPRAASGVVEAQKAPRTVPQADYYLTPLTSPAWYSSLFRVPAASISILCSRPPLYL